MLQGRLFSYGDAQRYRLGVNHHQIPVNQPKCPVHSFHRDGAMRVDGNQGSTLHYEPNSYGEWKEQPEYKEPYLALQGDADHWDFREDDDNYFEQPGNLFNLNERRTTTSYFANTARNMVVLRSIFKSAISNTATKHDPAYGEGVAKAIGIPMSEVEAELIEVK